MELATPNNESVINHEESLYLILADVACVGGVDRRCGMAHSCRVSTTERSLVMESGKKTFAFKLAEKKQSGLKDGKWTARAGVAVAGCTDPSGEGMYRASIYTDGRPAPLDKGYWC